MSSKSNPPDLTGHDVVERGGYSEQSAGPTADTTAWITGTPPGARSRSDGPPLVTFDTDKKPEPEVLSRDKLARGKPAAAPVEEEGLSRNTRMMILGGLVILSVGAVLAVMLTGGGAEQPVAAPETPEAEAPAAPDERTVDGIPVGRDMNRKPLPPKQK